MQAFEGGFGVFVERVVGRAHVGEFGVGRNRRNHARRKHRVAPGRVDEGRVGVPQAIGQAGHAAAVVGGQQRAVGADVGNVGQGLVAEAVFGQHRRRGARMQGAVEGSCEIDLFGIAKRLIAKHQHAVAVHAAAQHREGGGIARGAQVDGAHLGGE